MKITRLETIWIDEQPNTMWLRIHTDDGLIGLGDWEAVDRETLLRESDYLSFHAPLNDSNRRFLDAAALALMKPTAIVINTARGGLIDEEALLAAVQSGQIGGAALDVLVVEPPAPDHPLLHEPRVMITPHTGWYSEDASYDVRVRAVEEVVRVLRGERPRCPVNEIA